MVTVGSYEAKTHLPALLKRVGRGERIRITKHGVPIAMLVPIREASGDGFGLRDRGNPGPAQGK